MKVCCDDFFTLKIYVVKTIYRAISILAIYYFRCIFEVTTVGVVLLKKHVYFDSTSKA